jgi:hypothetical protein
MFTPDELATMQGAQEAHMMDTCQIGAYSRTDGATYGQSVEAWTYGAALDCGLEQQAGSERRKDDMTVEKWDAVLRLPIGTAINVKDKIKITARHGLPVTNLVYMVVSPPRVGASGLRILLEISAP